MLPSDVGCVVNNVDTVIAVGRAVCETMPSITRIVTVTGDAVWKPRNFQVRTGTLYSVLIEDAGGFRTEPEEIIAGGAMMGVALYTTLVPVTKISSALLCLSEDEVSANEPTACIRCSFFCLNHHFIMYSFKNSRRYDSFNFSCFRWF